jgi:magnesium-protoporphyrin IX monomethyl ester (oxidative) cyclase
LRDRLVACFQEMGAARREGAAPLRQFGLKLRFVALLWRQFFQPMVRAEAA